MRSRILALRALFVVIVMAVGSVAFGPASGASAAPTARAQLGHRPVVFVHGWHSGPGTWRHMIDKAEEYGYASNEIFPFDYSAFSQQGNGATPIKSLADKLAAYIRENKLLSRSPDGKIDIVAHSMGGLVSRAYLKQNQGHATTAHLVTLATPNHGTILSYFCPVAGPYCDEQAREMDAGSGFLTWLNSGTETPGNTHYATFRSNVGDEPMAPPSVYWCDKTVVGVDDDGEKSLKHSGRTSALKGAQNFVSPCVGHDQIANDDWTIEKALNWIADSDGAHTPKAAQIRCGDLNERWGKGSWPKPDGWVSAHAQSCVIATGAPHAATKSVHTELQIRGCGYWWWSVPAPTWWYAGVDGVNCDVHADGILWRDGYWGAHDKPSTSVYERWTQVRTKDVPAAKGAEVEGSWKYDVHAYQSSEWDVKAAKADSGPLVIQ
ncbi:esterase/lipase family protein [Streptomyces varsoviensis]|uniref:esterase/lipase family protein n=1 Tax=Streptomyces varsoviensis TaxID=67373 RepID=UPI00099830DB|nr:alpha/beta fold hydrolase [Streptomyces varsoviensis]